LIALVYFLVVLPATVLVAVALFVCIIVYRLRRRAQSSQVQSQQNGELNGIASDAIQTPQMSQFNWRIWFLVMVPLSVTVFVMSLDNGELIPPVVEFAPLALLVSLFIYYRMPGVPQRQKTTALLGIGLVMISAVLVIANVFR